ncbi:hypothetical protein ABZ307_42910 [Streptomyces griseorubiginosus]|uniref:hypothetical protein n=1 Tax=Streptomyces griseorubiginosus TaxID=67304 RepID=UPI0033BE4F3F
MPKDLPQYVGFLNGYEISSDELTSWLRTWIKVRAVPENEEWRLARTWMELGVAALYFIAVLTAAQNQTEAEPRTMTKRERDLSGHRRNGGARGAA